MLKNRRFETPIYLSYVHIITCFLRMLKEKRYVQEKGILILSYAASSSSRIDLIFSFIIRAFSPA